MNEDTEKTESEKLSAWLAVIKNILLAFAMLGFGLVAITIMITRRLRWLKKWEHDHFGPGYEKRVKQRD